MVAEKSIHFRFEGSLFLTANYTPILHHGGIPEDFHVMQDFLAHRCVGYCLKTHISISAKGVRRIWTTATLNDSESSLDFRYDGQVYHITPAVIRQTLKLPVYEEFDELEDDEAIRLFFKSIGYSGDVRLLGKLTRGNLRREWAFYFYTIGRAFTGKCTNFDAITQTCQQIGYALIYELHECLPSIGRNLIDFTQSLTLSLKPKKDCPRICDASGPFISGYAGMERKLTAIAFPSHEQDQAHAYLHRNSTTYEFKPLLLYKKEGGQMYVLGEYAGFTLEEWIEKGPVLWESSGESSRTTGRGRKPTDAFKIVGQNIATVLYKLHEKDDYVGNIFTDVCINTLTSRITILCTLPKQLCKFNI